MTMKEKLEIAALIVVLFGAAWAAFKVLTAGWRWRRTRKDGELLLVLRKFHRETGRVHIDAEPGSENYDVAERLVEAGKLKRSRHGGYKLPEDPDDY